MIYPENKIYIRVRRLVNELIERGLNLDTTLGSYAYLRTIGNFLESEQTLEKIIKTEKHILSPGFLKQKCFSGSDLSDMKEIIRDYKLEMLYND